LEIIKDMAVCEKSKIQKTVSKDILEARKLIEIESAKKAAEICDNKDLKKLFDIVEREEALINEKSDDYKKIAVNDFRFHYFLTKMSKNMVYHAVMNSFMDTVIEMTKVFYKNNISYFREHVKKHRLISEAISRKDSQEAARILEEILLHWK
ncbi:MAG: FadR/GntR family transcriptional regulator, partial [Bacillota bacterium]